MSNSTNVTRVCASDDRLCIIKEHQVELIVIPVLLLGASFCILGILCFLSLCHKKEKHQNFLRQHFSHSRQHLQGIDAPPELNPLEYESVPMTTQTQTHKPHAHQPAKPQLSTEVEHCSCEQITPLPLSFTVKPDNTVTLYQAMMDQKPVVLRVLKGPYCYGGTAGFYRKTTFLNGKTDRLRSSQYYTDLITQKEHLHSKECTHGNIGAQSVLVDQDLSVKLWGFGPAFRRRMKVGTSGEVNIMMRKWQAPEVLANQPVSECSDIWSFGILLYEMVTLGEPPFPKVMASELLQHLQRGKTLKRPMNCSNSLYSIIKACCQFRPQDRAPLKDVISMLQSAESHASDRVVLSAPEQLDIEKYMQEAGYEETCNFAVL